MGMIQMQNKNKKDHVYKVRKVTLVTILLQ